MRLINAGKAIEQINKWLNQTRRNSPIYKLSLWAVKLYWALPHNRRWACGAWAHRKQWDCSECGYPIPTDNRLDYIDKSEVRYCYYCGAKMEVEPWVHTLLPWPFCGGEAELYGVPAYTEGLGLYTKVQNDVMLW